MQSDDKVRLKYENSRTSALLFVTVLLLLVLLSCVHLWILVPCV